MNEQELRTRTKSLLYSQLYGVLCTQGEAGAPHASIIAYASADNLASIIFATPRNTRKYAYMLARQRVAFFVDDRRARKEELMEVTGLEVQGMVKELRDRERDDYRTIFLSRHPDMTAFVDAPDSALMRLAVQRYDAVDHFQHVLILDMAVGEGFAGASS